MTTVVLQLSSALDRELSRHVAARGRRASAPKALASVLAESAGLPTPLFESAPASDDQRVWYLDMADDRAQGALHDLLATPGIEAAYLKPADALPGSP